MNLSWPEWEIIIKDIRELSKFYLLSEEVGIAIARKHTSDGYYDYGVFFSPKNRRIIGLYDFYWCNSELSFRNENGEYSNYEDYQLKQLKEMQRKRFHLNLPPNIEKVESVVLEIYSSTVEWGKEERESKIWIEGGWLIIEKKSYTWDVDGSRRFTTIIKFNLKTGEGEWYDIE